MQKLKIIILFLLVIGHWSLVIPEAYASGYVLPYPSYMPGHKLYRIHQVWEKVQEYWHFGNVAKFKYHRRMADKYLVEAKTLFEYQQYPLALTALKKSNEHFRKEKTYKETLFSEQGIKHREVLVQLIEELPGVFIWQPEKKPAVKLEIKKELEKAKAIREKI